jgi:outer membrane usher protein FimD/PapC
MDANGNGRRDPDEQIAPDAAVEVGSTRVRTDASGRYSTWSVIPYDVARVRLDTATLADPAWVPGSAERLLRPSPHMYMDADFPLVQTRELSGTLVAARDVRGVGGVTVEISAPGAEPIRTLTFSDGTFYLGRVRPGEYEVRVSESSLRALGARSDPASVRVVVPAGGDQQLVEVPPIQIRRAR